MSTKDNWDDESSDEEVDMPTDPQKGDMPIDLPKGDMPHDPLLKGEINPLEEYHEAQFVDDDEVPPEDQTDEECCLEGGTWGDAPQEDSDYDDYDDELDNYDKKLGRYVAVR